MPNKTSVSRGDRFGRWEVIGQAEPARNRHGYPIRRVLCRCHCKDETLREVRLANLVRGLSVSCGCVRREVTIKRSTKHSLCKHPLYGIWQIMKYRCSHPSHPVYASYNSLNIAVCDEWMQNFSAFFDWALSSGWQPGLDIDRRNNLDGYSPSNCRFVTRMQNCHNKRTNRLVEYHGETMCVTELARRVGLNHKTICSRLDRGQDVAHAVMRRPLTRDSITGKWT